MAVFPDIVRDLTEIGKKYPEISDVTKWYAKVSVIIVFISFEIVRKSHCFCRIMLLSLRYVNKYFIYSAVAT